MFDLLETGNSYLRIRRIAVLLLAASLVLLIATYAWYQLSSSADELPFEYIGPNAVELGLAYGALLGSVLAVGLFVWSFIKRRQSRK